MHRYRRTPRTPRAIARGRSHGLRPSDLFIGLLVLLLAKLIGG